MNDRDPVTVSLSDDEIEAPPTQTHSNPNIAMIVPHGYKLRDEFVCPITRELIVDPVIAADGHTYDRAAIEQWLHGSQRRMASPSNHRRTSPKTGQPLEHMHLIPNHNLKRLIRDMIKEGGESLYCADESSNPQPNARVPKNTMNKGPPTPTNKVSAIPRAPARNPSPRLALVREMILTCRCLGPPESDWNGRSFRLTESSLPTLLGGRRRPHEQVQNADFVQFTDATVSRRHFEITLQDERKFALRDLGSAGGTFVRIPPRKGVPLAPGTMIMLGKHQLLAMEAGEEEAVNEPCEEVEEKVIGAEIDVTTPRYGDQGESLLRRSTVPVFFGERLNEGLENVSETGDTNSENGSVNGDVNEEEFVQEPNRGRSIMDREENSCGSDRDSQDKSDDLAADDLDQLCPSVPCLLQGDSNDGSNSLRLSIPPPESMEHANTSTKADKASSTSVPSDSLIVLRCFAPEGTPIQGREYPVGPLGATLGRKQGNSISFSHKLCETTGGSASNKYSFVGIDSSISGEHATVVYNESKGMLELFDGVGDKCSTNGTWVRLSPMHKQSEWYPLEDKTEILIGTVRFQVSIDEVVVEKDIYE